MLRVLVLSTLFPDAARPRFGPFVERQAQELAKQPGVEVRVVAPRGIPPLGAMIPRYRALAALPEVEARGGLTVHRPRFIHAPGLAGRLDARLLARALLPVLRNIQRDFVFDVIDAQFFWPDGVAAVALGRALGVPVSVKARGGDIHFWGSFAAPRRAMVAAAARADTMLAVSQALKDDMIALGMPAARIAVHHTGVDHDVFKPADRPAAKAALGVTGALIATVGALIERKGQDVLIAALPHLADATLVIAGQGPARGRYEALAAKLGVADRVRFAGTLGQAEVARLMAAADVMALPSVSEGLANVWVEALACGTPVVIPDVGGTRELLTAPAGGRISAREPRAIAEAISAVLADPPAPEAARELTLGFTWARNAAALRAHLEALVSPRGG